MNGYHTIKKTSPTVFRANYNHLGHRCQRWSYKPMKDPDALERSESAIECEKGKRFEIDFTPSLKVPMLNWFGFSGGRFAVSGPVRRCVRPSIFTHLFIIAPRSAAECMLMAL